MTTLQVLQEWEGHVVWIDDREFVARLIDLTAGHSHETEEATIPLTNISEHDISRMSVGSIFRWVIGYECSPDGTRKRVSQIGFLDPREITEDDYKAGEAWARKVMTALNLPETQEVR